MKGGQNDAIEKVIAVRYETLGELGVGSSSTVYEVCPIKEPTKRSVTLTHPTTSLATNSFLPKALLTSLPSCGHG